MSSNDLAIQVSNLGKRYEIYDSPRDRLKQFILPRLGWGKQGPHAYFREFWALQNVSFEVRRGETIGIIGRNGCGKSTLLQMICGTLTPTTGNVQTHGRIAALLELGAGFNPEFTGRENVYLNATVLGLTRQEVDSRFDDIVTFADIGEFIDQPVKTYSSGMYVRLAFAVIAHVDADTLIVDEALAVGDVFFQQKCMRYLRALQARGGTVVFVSHDTSAVVNLCDRAILLSRGKPAVTGKTDEICRLYIEDVYAERAPVSAATPSQVATADAQPSDGIRVFTGAIQVPNLIRISPFRPDANSFGMGAVQIVDTWFEDDQALRTENVEGGAAVAFCLRANVLREIGYPAFGFMLKDRLGQYLFAEGTDQAYRSDPPTVAVGDTLVVKFAFLMPILIQGDYSLNVAVAEGAGDDHVQHHWINDVMALHSLSSRLVHGISGLQDMRISIEVSSGLIVE
jgi:lipopolysaccharide transport system ATP-binding protein